MGAVETGWTKRSSRLSFIMHTSVLMWSVHLSLLNAFLGRFGFSAVSFFLSHLASLSL